MSVSSHQKGQDKLKVGFCFDLKLKKYVLKLSITVNNISVSCYSYGINSKQINQLTWYDLKYQFKANKAICTFNCLTYCLNKLYLKNSELIWQ